MPRCSLYVFYCDNTIFADNTVQLAEKVNGLVTQVQQVQEGVAAENSRKPTVEYDTFCISLFILTDTALTIFSQELQKHVKHEILYMVSWKH